MCGKVRDQNIRKIRLRIRHDPVRYQITGSHPASSGELIKKESKDNTYRRFIQRTTTSF